VSLRWQHLHIGQGSASASFTKLDIPAIPLIAHRIRRVHVAQTNALAATVGNIQWGLFHFLGHADVGAGTSGFLRDHENGLWLASGFTEPGAALQTFTFARDEDMLVAGPQDFGVSNGAGQTIQMELSVAYEEVNLDLTAWTLLKTRTSFEED